MDKKMLQETIRQFKRATALAGCKADYAISNPDSYGCEGSDVQYNIEKKYGDHATGIWANHYNRGYNAYPPIEEVKDVCFNHNLTDEQVDVFYAVFGKHYNIFPPREEWSIAWCPTIYEKDTPVWAVYHEEHLNEIGGGIRPNWLTADRDSVIRRLDCRKPDNFTLVIKRIF